MSAPQPKSPKPQYSFTSFQVNNPTSPPPGDKLDSEYAQTAKVISDVIAWVGTSLNSDGSLRATPPGIAPTDTGDAAQAGLYANLAGAWAEHMPDTIPPDVLAVMAITGDHWSSRWWANQAARLVQAANPPFLPGLDFAGPGTIPPGVAGDINIRNGTAAPITITLPTGPVSGQALKFKDAQGNAGTYAITLQGAAGATIDGNVTYRLVSDYMAIELYWMGTQWGTR